MTSKDKRQLLYWLENILKPIEEAICSEKQNPRSDHRIPTPEWYQIGCVLREFIEKADT
jgi:hypothetical protein